MILQRYKIAAFLLSVPFSFPARLQGFTQTEGPFTVTWLLTGWPADALLGFQAPLGFSPSL
jgi:hypothetical protein